MNIKKACIPCMLAMLLFQNTTHAKDSEDPFLDPSDSNPSESIRRLGKLMNRLASRKPTSKNELEKLQESIMDRMTRTLLTMEKEREEQTSSSGGGSGSSRSSSKSQSNSSGSKRNNIKHKNQTFQPQGNEERQSKSNNPAQRAQKNKGEGSNKSNPDKDKNSVQVKDAKDRWGQLPPKVREALQTNLARDVPDELEEDMKDFIRRMEELK